MKFDKLNKLEGKYGFFEPMAISVEDKARRVELADLLTDAFLYFFSVYEVHQMHNSMLAKALYEQLLADKISDAVSKVTGIDAEISNHIRQLSKEVVETTFKHADKDSNTQVRQNANAPNPTYEPFTASLYDSAESLDLPDDIPSDSHIVNKTMAEEDDDDTEDDMEREAVADYWLSIRRAINIAQNESNTFLNYTDFVEAKDRGYTKKTWLTMLDNLVRDTHEEVEGQTVDIDDTFRVGESLMRFPHDWEYGADPKEVVNCRCAVEYK